MGVRKKVPLSERTKVEAIAIDESAYNKGIRYVPPMISSHISPLTYQPFNSLSPSSLSLLIPSSVSSEVTKSSTSGLAKIHPSLLTTLSQNHRWVIGAISELIHNSVQAKARRIDLLLGDKVGSGWDRVW